MLSGHTDVVPVEGQAWSGDPFAMREIDGKLFGRGACDMKGFDAAVLAMVPEFLAAKLERPIHILLSYDEETTLPRLARRYQALRRRSAAPRRRHRRRADADGGRRRAQGRRDFPDDRDRRHEGHSANPRLGANAIAAAGDIVAEIGRLARECEAPEFCDPRFEPPYSTFHVGVIHGGTARNILARECVFHWEFRGLPKMPSSVALGRVQKFVDEVALPRLRRFVPHPTIETKMEVDVPGLAAEPDSPAATLALALSQSNRTIAVSYATEAGHFQRAGLPTIVCGPGSIEQAHVADEYLSVSDLEGYLEFLRRLARTASS